MLLRLFCFFSFFPIFFQRSRRAPEQSELGWESLRHPRTSKMSMGASRRRGYGYGSKLSSNMGPQVSVHVFIQSSHASIQSKPFWGYPISGPQPFVGGLARWAQGRRPPEEADLRQARAHGGARLKKKVAGVEIWVWLKIKRSEGQTAGFGNHVSTDQSSPFWNSGGLSHGHRMQDEIDEIREAFNLFDTDGSGTIDPCAHLHAFLCFCLPGIVCSGILFRRQG